MRFFICAMEGILLGIPAEQAEKIIPAASPLPEHCISLPELFRQQEAAVHGIVLKAAAANTAGAVLLTPKIDIDMEIPEADIRGLPGALAGVFAYFRGAYFGSHGVILILDPKKLKEGIQ